MPHKCHAQNCAREIPPRYLMCGPHWAMVPRAMQKAVRNTYRLGQEVDKNPSEEYICAARAAIALVAKREERQRAPRSALGL